MPIFARMEVNAANTADSNAKINHIVFSSVSVLIGVGSGWYSVAAHPMSAATVLKFSYASDVSSLPPAYVCRQHVDFLVLLRRLSMSRNRNSPAAQTVDFCSCYARKTAKIFLSLACRHRRAAILTHFKFLLVPFVFRLPAIRDIGNICFPEQHSTVVGECIYNPLVN